MRGTRIRLCGVVKRHKHVIRHILRYSVDVSLAVSACFYFRVGASRVFLRHPRNLMGLFYLNSTHTQKFGRLMTHNEQPGAQSTHETTSHCFEVIIVYLVTDHTAHENTSSSHRLCCFAIRCFLVIFRPTHISFLMFGMLGMSEFKPWCNHLSFDHSLPDTNWSYIYTTVRSVAEADLLADFFSQNADVQLRFSETC